MVKKRAEEESSSDDEIEIKQIEEPEEDLTAINKKKQALEKARIARIRRKEKLEEEKQKKIEEEIEKRLNERIKGIQLTANNEHVSESEEEEEIIKKVLIKKKQPAKKKPVKKKKIIYLEESEEEQEEEQIIYKVRQRTPSYNQKPYRSQASLYM